MLGTLFFIIMEIVTLEYLLSKGFEKHTNIGWAKIRKNGFELVEIPLKNGGFVIGFEYQFCSQTKYKYPIKISELEQLYKFLTGK
jgi:hypothetical protein